MSNTEVTQSKGTQSQGMQRCQDGQDRKSKNMAGSPGFVYSVLANQTSLNHITELLGEQLGTGTHEDPRRAETFIQGERLIQGAKSGL